MDLPIEIIARGAFIKDGQILCVRQKEGASNIFLPGGHVDHGEAAGDALLRELREVLGLDADLGEFLGVIEHAYTPAGEARVHEINLVFSFRIDGQSPPESLRISVSNRPDWLPLAGSEHTYLDECNACHR